ncbi:MAG: TylF/MycF/NovP-related O-methyltransferase [Verrucomicrobiota bacterium]
MKRATPCPAPIKGTDSEPWVKLETEQNFTAWTHEDLIRHNQTSRQIEKALFYRRAFDYLECLGIQGDYFEYGCHRVRTFRMALTEARRHFMDSMRFFAFDSFEGLPPAKTKSHMSGWTRGNLFTSERDFLRLVRQHGIYLDRIRIFKGFYNTKLTTALEKRLLSHCSRIALVTIDCDLYESAVPVFRFIDPLLQEGSLIYIDDLFAGYKGNPLKGVSRAFLEYQKKSRWNFVRHLDIGWWGRSYITYKAERPFVGVL